MKKIPAILTLAAALLMAAPSGYRILGTIEIGTEGGWDYVTVDSAAQRLYVSHATRVVVIDLKTEKVLGEIPDTPGVHGIAIAPKLNRGFISNGRGNNVTVFDLKTMKATGQVATGQGPDAILFDPSSDRVFTFNGRSKDVTAFEAESGTVVATIPVGGKPEFAAADGKGAVWANIEDTHEIVEIDAAKAAVTKRYDLAGCEEPSGLAFDAKHRRLFSMCANKVMAVSDPAAGKVIATVPIGAGTDGGGFDPDRGYAFSSNGRDGTITVVHEKRGKYEVLDTVTTEPGARTMAVDPATHKLYLPTAKFGPAPAPTEKQPRPRPPMLPGTFHIVVVGK